MLCGQQLDAVVFHALKGCWKSLTGMSVHKSSFCLSNSSLFSLSLSFFSGLLCYLSTSGNGYQCWGLHVSLHPELLFPLAGQRPRRPEWLHPESPGSQSFQEKDLRRLVLRNQSRNQPRPSVIPRAIKASSRAHSRWAVIIRAEA